MNDGFIIAPFLLKHWGGFKVLLNIQDTLILGYSELREQTSNFCRFWENC